MIRTAGHISSLDFGIAVLVLGLAAVAVPQLGVAQVDTVSQASDRGRWAWARDHWVWTENREPETRGTEIREAGIADARGAPLHEAGLTVRRMIAVAMSAP